MTHPNSFFLEKSMKFLELEKCVSGFLIFNIIMGWSIKSKQAGGPATERACLNGKGARGPATERGRAALGPLHAHDTRSSAPTACAVFLPSPILWDTRWDTYLQSADNAQARMQHTKHSWTRAKQCTRTRARGGPAGTPTACPPTTPERALSAAHHTRACAASSRCAGAPAPAPRAARRTSEGADRKVSG
jgi:hypothetical protein